MIGSIVSNQPGIDAFAIYARSDVEVWECICRNALSIGQLDGIQLRILVYDATPSTQGRVGKVWQDPGIGVKTYTRHLLGNFFIEDVNSD